MHAFMQHLCVSETTDPTRPGESICREGRQGDAVTCCDVIVIKQKGKLIIKDTFLRKKRISIIFSSSDCIFLATRYQYLTTLRKLKHSL